MRPSTDSSKAAGSAPRPAPRRTSQATEQRARRQARPMYRDGFLIRCGAGSYEPQRTVFCVFEDGKLSLYSDKGGYLVGELPLAGHVTKVRVEKAQPGKLPFRFSVTSTEVMRVEGRRMKLGEARVVEFAAPSNDLMKEWANSLHLWRRMSWRDNVKFFDDSRDMTHAEERDALQANTRALKDARTRRSITGNMSKKIPNPLKNMLHTQASPSVRKLKQMMRHPTRSTASSTPCTASSSA